MLGVLLYHLGAFFSRVLPAPIPQGIARALGEVNWVFRWRTHRVIADNLRRAHPGASRRVIRQLAHATVINFARSIQVFLELPFMSWEDVRGRVDFSEFFRAVDALPRKDTGFVMASAHVGPWELGGYCLSQLGYQVYTVALDHPSVYVTKFFSDRRARFGIHAFPLEHSFHKLRAALEQGHCVGLLIDRTYGNARRRDTLFGVEREFPLGHALLAARAGVPVFVGVIVFDGRRRFRYVHGGTHIPDPSLDEDERAYALHAACLRDLEGLIRTHSNQWFHFRRLAPRRSPAGTSDATPRADDHPAGSGTGGRSAL